MADDDTGTGNGADPLGGHHRQFDEINDPWLLLTEMRKLEVAERGLYWTRWLTLLQTQSKQSRDALMHEGRDVWKIRVETVRAAIREIDQVAEGLSRISITVDAGEDLVETVYARGTDHEYGYLVHRHAHPEDPPEWAETYTLGKTIHYPPTSKLIEMGTILLPSGVEEYGSDWELFTMVRDFISQYLHLDSPNFRTLATCYVLMSWVFDRFEVVPYLRAQGDLGTGKTRLLDVIGGLCYRPIRAGGATTPAPIFRIIDRFRGTLIIDEADFSRSELWDEIVKILNFGYQRGWAVLRAERVGDGFDVAAYDCYSPKLLASRRRFADAALESRCFSHTMPLLHEIPEGMNFALDAEFRLQQQALRNRLLLWRFRHYSIVKVDPAARLPGVEPRVNQIVQPLLACVQDDRIRSSVLGMMKDYGDRLKIERRESPEGQIVYSLLKCWLQRRKPAELPLSAVVESLDPEEAKGANLTSRAVGDRIRRILRVPMHQHGGYSHIKLTPYLAKDLGRKYGLTMVEYGGL